MAAELTIAPGILVAMPQLNDPNFRRSVILVAEHNEEGSFGLVLNRPTDDLVCNLISSLEMDWCGDEQAEVWMGGPVQPETGWVLHEPVPGLGEPGWGSRARRCTYEFRAIPGPWPSTAGATCNGWTV